MSNWGIKWVQWKKYHDKKLTLQFLATLYNSIDILNNYFEYRWGVRQYDHLFSYLFILLAEGLNKLLSRTMLSNHIKGLDLISPFGHQVLNLQYADDMLIFLHADY
jgi:hypothetical protein